ncbi:hypothetical protein HDV05_003011 [Chytridiales sp. JEL 0842]|nr:hypothetical protein HDV05_003011 [Chytridiales sp. JEL 0842]
MVAKTLFTILWAIIAATALPIHIPQEGTVHQIATRQNNASVPDCNGAHIITVTLSVDNSYNSKYKIAHFPLLEIALEANTEFVLDKVYLPHSPFSTHYTAGVGNWQDIRTYTSTVQGAGPFLVAIEAYDKGVIAGIAAVVTVDGEYYTSTGIPNSQFKLRALKNSAAAALIDPEWRSQANFDESGWIVATGEPRTSRASAWGTIESRVATVAGVNKPVRMSWAPDSNAVNAINYARVVITPPGNQIVEK